MTDSAKAIRDLVDKEVELFLDTDFDREKSYVEKGNSIRKEALDKLHKLRSEKKKFFEEYNYDWAFESEFYRDPYDAFMQWRLLNVISDIPKDHPKLKNCKNIIVRSIPSSLARVHIRKAGKFHIIILPHGYLSVLKGFLRIFFKGRALGRLHHDGIENCNYAHQRDEYVLGALKEEDKLHLAAKAYIGLIIQIMNGEKPIMDQGSMFDEELIKREEFGLEFGKIAHAVDGFILFHELDHILSEDFQNQDSFHEYQMEISADQGSVSLCIIDEARKGGVGTLHIGAPIFFYVELLRLLTEEIAQIAEGRHNPDLGRYVGIEELLARSEMYEKHIFSYFPPIVPMYREWRKAMEPVYDTVRWSLLKMIDNKATHSISLLGFIVNQS